MSEFNLLGKDWMLYKMDDIFVFHKGKRILKEDMVAGNTNFIAAIDDNNGVRQKIDLPALHDGNCITVNYNGSVGEAFYQDEPFRASDDVNILYPKGWNLNRNIGLFLSTIIRHNKYRFGYGRKWNLDKMKETNIALPVDGSGNPDWAFMESYIDKIIDLEKINTKIKHKELPFDVKKWKSFIVGDLFQCMTTKACTSCPDEDGTVPYVTRTAANNGVEKFIKQEAGQINLGNCISIGAEGKYAFYQAADFIAGVKVYTLRHNNINKYNALFVISVLNKEVFKYNYGRARILEKIKQESIKLPVDKLGNPDWDYMEDYIKSLPYADLI